MNDLEMSALYLSSKGKDVAVRQAHMTWRQNFLQQGMQGTAILFGNGSVDDAMQSFPPTSDVLQDAFAAVFTGPEQPTHEEALAMEGTTEEARQKREEMARKAQEEQMTVFKLKKRRWQGMQGLLNTFSLFLG